MLHAQNIETDPRWKDLYRVGGITVLVISVLTTLTVVAYFIWPYIPGRAPIRDIYAAIDEGLLPALAALDTGLLVGILAQIPLILALYIALRRYNESYALIAVVVGLVSIIAVLPSRPVLEVMNMGRQYMAASTAEEQLMYMAAGETLLSVFHGTSWAISILFMAVAYLILFALMLRSPHFRKLTAILGLVANVGALGFMVPLVGPLLLLISTFSGIIMGIPLGLDLLGLSKQAGQADG